MFFGKRKVFLISVFCLLFLFVFSLYFLSTNRNIFYVGATLTQECANRGGVCVSGYSALGVACVLPGGGLGITLELCGNPADSTCCVPVDNIDDDDRNGNTDRDCVKEGGQCLSGYPSVGAACSLSGNRSGKIKGGLCMSRPGDMQYRCCVPDEEEDEDDRERVYGDGACDYIEGQCHWVSGRTFGNLGECTTVHDEPGCYVYGACRVEPHEMREGQFYLCCTADENLCGQGVDYSLWEDLHVNEEGCPFSNPSETGDKLWCSQGPQTGPSHTDYSADSVDINLRHMHEGELMGSEYFIAPEDGEITDAWAFTTNPGTIGTDGAVQRCGCDLRFRGNSGIEYEIRHCLLFTGLSVHFDAGVRGREGTGRPKAGKPLKITKGTVLAKIAQESDDSIVTKTKDGSIGCWSGPHFHVRVEGADRCVDCHFVDNLGCNLFNDGSKPDDVHQKGLCGRCYRREFPKGCFGDGRVADWGGVKCDDTCAGCNIDDKHYCCESDKVWCCVGPPTAQICAWVCKCPHPTPTGPGWGIGGSGGDENSGSEAPDWIL